VVIADHAKVAPMLGAFSLPIEVVAFGHLTTARRIVDGLVDCDIAATPRLREKDGKAVLTDGGNLIYDAPCGVIADPSALADALKSITGVVDHGLVLDLADEALVAGPDGVQRLTR
jgi:ribose 5-phosphate isomerase A